MKKILGFLTALVLLVSCAATWAEGEWAEERKAAREFTAGFTAALTDRDMLTFVMLYGNENSYVLGETALRDMERDRWILSEEYDGAFSPPFCVHPRYSLSASAFPSSKAFFISSGKTVS